MEGCRNTHQRDPSQLVKEGDRYVDIHGVNNWLLPCQALVFAAAECLPLLKNEIRMPFPVDFPVTNHCETCLFYVFSFVWSSRGMILLEVGLQCVLLKGIWLKKIMMGSKQSWNSWASSRPWERLPAAQVSSSAKSSFGKLPIAGIFLQSLVTSQNRCVWLMKWVSF